jgi:hypothetical protein
VPSAANRRGCDKIPCFVALRELVALPRTVFGPVDFAEFTLFASILRSDTFPGSASG